MAIRRLKGRRLRGFRRYQLVKHGTITRREATNRLAELGLMRVLELYLSPKVYTSLGDRPIRLLPLINTSLEGLAKAGWWLSVTGRYIQQYHHTTVRYHFCDPDKNGNPFLTFKLWAKGNLCNSDEAMATRLVIHEMLDRDLTPGFSKQPSWRIGPVPVIQKEVRVVHEREDELTFLQRINDERGKALEARKKVDKTHKPVPERLNHIEEQETYEPIRGARIEELNKRVQNLFTHH